MASPVEWLKSLRVDKLLITHQHFNLSTFKQKQAKLAFTMAEILLSLTIIGVVAAITLPSLTGNINERTWHTQRKVLYSRMSQAIALMPALNGYGTTDDNAAETFITSGLSKVLKINNICGKDNLSDCGLADKYADAKGTKQDLPKEIQSLNAGIITDDSVVSIRNTKAAAFETANGESVLAFYNPECKAGNLLIEGVESGGTKGYYIKQQVCANFIFDLNGKKGPNTIGKDVGVITVAYSTDSSVVMPLYPKNPSHGSLVSHAEATTACRNMDEGQYRLPNLEELLSIYYNRLLFTDVFYNAAWASTTIDSGKAYAVGAGMGIKYPLPKDRPYAIICVERN